MVSTFSTHLLDINVGGVVSAVCVIGSRLLLPLILSEHGLPIILSEYADLYNLRASYVLCLCYLHT